MVTSPKAIILRVAGTNCERETKIAFEKAGISAEIVHLNCLKRKRLLRKYQILCLPGGFSYGDYISAGKVFALEMENRLGDDLRDFIQKDRLILGICNGFQILVKLGLLPFSDFSPSVSLILNDSGHFEDRWVWLKREEKSKSSFWFSHMPQVFPLPVAHAEGKFYTEVNLLDKIEIEKLIALRYVDEKGAEAGYPYNPNGSLRNIAAIINPTGRILGMMPHPERYIYSEHCPYQKERVSQAWGLEIFRNIKKFFS